MTRAAKAFGAPGNRTPRWVSSISRSVLMWLVGMALTPSRAAQDGMARIDTAELDDRHSRRGAPRVSKPTLTKLFSLLLCERSNIVVVENKSTAPLPAAGLLRLYS